MRKWDRRKVTVNRLRKLAGELQDEAYKISPKTKRHPAPLLHHWAHRLYSAAELLEKK